VLALDSGDEEGLADSYTFLSVNSGDNDAATAANPALGTEEVVFDSQPTLPEIAEAAELPKCRGTVVPPKSKVDSRADWNNPGRTIVQKAFSPHATRAHTAKTPLKPR
jgi:hypothetical protein